MQSLAEIYDRNPYLVFQHSTAHTGELLAANSANSRAWHRICRFSAVDATSHAPRPMELQRFFLRGRIPATGS
jgi:hypothetical protein